MLYNVVSTSTSFSTVRVGIGHQRLGSWLLRPGGGCALAHAGGKLLRLNDQRRLQPCCKLINTGRSLLVESYDPSVDLRIGRARVERAELPLNGRFRLAGEWVCFQQVRPHSEHELLPGMVGCSASMRRLASMVARVAQFEVPTLLLGESGTGKELVARALHKLGPRAEQPFVVVNAAELSEQLGGSALFGHVRGAYTGADRQREGAFRRANGGTLFLDEIAELTPALQAHLLRVVEQGCVAAVGDDASQSIDVRLVVATCQPLRQLVEAHRFRLDLYQRLAVHTLRLPPLRERRGDVQLIAQRLMQQPPWLGYSLAADALDPLASHEFGGNVRELRNLLAQAVLFCDDEQQVIDAESVARAMHDAQPTSGRRPLDVLGLLQRCDGNVSVAARQAGLARSTFRDRVRKAQLNNPPLQRILADPAPSAMLVA